MKILHFIILGMLAMLLIPINVYAEQNVTSFSLEETTIITVENTSSQDIHSIRMWGSENYSFESFKTEDGWLGELSNVGVLIFKSTVPLQPGESAKFGVKTTIASPVINWKTLDKDGNQIETSTVVPSPMQDFTESHKESTENKPVNPVGIKSESKFRIVPEKPTAGSLFRVTGDSFGASQKFDFYIDKVKAGDFVTDKDGNFMTTMQIPDDQAEGRIALEIKDSQDNGLIKSIRIEHVEARKLVTPDKPVPLTVDKIPETVYRGEDIVLSGSGEPSIPIVVNVIEADENIFSTTTTATDTKGKWKLPTPFTIPLNMPLETYEITISDGRTKIQKQITIESGEVIVLEPSTIKYEFGEIMLFNGTALPNIPLEVLIKGPTGFEIFSDVIDVNESGIATFEYDTSFENKKGTYTIIATQGNEKQFIFVGIEELPIIPVLIEFDKLNYKSSETATMTLVGTPLATVNLLILTPADQPKENAIPIMLGSDGKAEHQLDLKGFSSGVYTAIVSKGTSQNSENFSVGLLTGSGEITIRTTQQEYLAGDPMIILGQTDPAVLLSLSLIDPEGNNIKEREIFSSKEGIISESSFKFPTDAQSGTWKIHAKSGSNFYSHLVKVIPSTEEGLIISIEKGEELGGLGSMLEIRIQGVNVTTEFEIHSADGKIIESFTSSPSKTGEIKQPWLIPPGTAPGTYTLVVYEEYKTVKTDFEIQ